MSVSSIRAILHVISKEFSAYLLRGCSGPIRPEIVVSTFSKSNILLLQRTCLPKRLYEGTEPFLRPKNIATQKSLSSIERPTPIALILVLQARHRNDLTAM